MTKTIVIRFLAIVFFCMAVMVNKSETLCNGHSKCTAINNDSKKDTCKGKTTQTVKKVPTPRPVADTRHEGFFIKI